MKNPVGRPTDYSEAYQIDADSYVDGGYQDQKDVIPSIVGLAHFLKKPAKTLRAWGENFPQFRATLDRCLDEQHRITLNGGLANTFQPTITKLVLANHGYSDKQSVDHTSGGDKIKSFSEMYASTPKSE